MKMKTMSAIPWRRMIPAAVAVVLLLPATVGLQSQATPAQQKQYSLAVVFPTWKNAEEEEKAGPIMQQHFQHMKELFDSGKLILAGPREDRVYGIAVLEAGPDEVQRIMLDDPAVKAGVFRLEVHALQVAFLRKTN